MHKASRPKTSAICERWGDHWLPVYFSLLSKFNNLTKDVDYSVSIQSQNMCQEEVFISHNRTGLAPVWYSDSELWVSISNLTHVFALNREQAIKALYMNNVYIYWTLGRGGKQLWFLCSFRNKDESKPMNNLSGLLNTSQISSSRPWQGRWKDFHEQEAVEEDLLCGMNSW